MNLAVQLVPPVCREIPLPRNAFHQPANYNVDPFQGHNSKLRQRQENGADEGQMEWPTVARKGSPDRDEVRSGLHEALTTKIPQYRNPSKEVAARIGTSEATVRGLRQANIPEAMVTLVMFARMYPDFGAEVRRLMGLESDLDPIAERVFNDLRQLVANRSAGK